LGILLLVAYFACYMTALSWADLTYVLPASSLGYVLLAFIAKYHLHEQITNGRWLGIALITLGVGFVAGGPHKTHPVATPPHDVAAETVPARGGR
jgi:drug/metabolite transporter (DMT)-like permease